MLNDLILAKGKKIIRKIFKILGGLILGLIILIVCLLLFIRSPWGQEIVVGKVLDYYQNKTGAPASIDRLFITFSGNIFLEGLYLEDLQGDTLLYSGKLEAGVQILPLIKNGEINLTKFDWMGLRANVYRAEGDSSFNYDFILEAFLAVEADEEKQVAEETDEVSDFPEINLSPISMEDFKVRYEDGEMGMLALLDLGKFNLDMPGFDLNKMEFYLKDFLFENSEITYIQSKPLPESEPTEEALPLPLLVVDDFLISQVRINYDSEPDGIQAAITLGQLGFNIQEADMTAQKVLMSNFSLLESDIDITLVYKESGEEVSAEEGDFGIEWPDWIVELGSLSLLDNRVALKTGTNEPIPGAFDPDNLVLDPINLEVNNLFLKDKKAGFDLQRLEFKERSGFDLKTFAFKLKIDDTSLNLDQLEIRTNGSQLSGNVDLGYRNLATLLDEPESTSFNLDIPVLEIDPRDGYFFVPELRSDPMLAEIGKNKLLGQVNVRGNLDQLEIRALDANWGQNTSMEIRGMVKHPMETENLQLDLPEINFSTRRKDVIAFVNEAELGISVPDSIDLSGTFKGSLEIFVTDLQLQTSDGNVSFVGNANLRDRYDFEGNVELIDLQLQKILDNEQLGPLTGSLAFSAEGDALENLDGNFSLSFDALEYNGYDFSNLLLEGKIKEGVGDMELNYVDENLDMDLTGEFVLDSIAPALKLELDLRGANLMALGLTRKDIRTGFEMSLDFKGNADEFDLNTAIRNGVAVFDGRNFGMGDFDVDLSVQKDSTHMLVESRIINAELASNANPELIASALSHQMRNYFREEPLIDSALLGVEMYFDLTFNSSPVIDQVFVEGLNRLDSMKVNVDFKSSSSFLNARVDLPFVDYAGIEVDSLVLLVDMDESDFDFNFGISNLLYGPMDLGRTYFEGSLANKEMILDFISWDEDEKLVHVGSDISFSRDSLLFHIDPEELIFNKRDWTIPASNQIKIAENWLEFTDFDLERNNQRLSISDEPNESGGENILLLFRDFRLATFTSLFNPDELIATGILEGSFSLINPFGALGFLADLEIKDLVTIGIPLGNMSLGAESTAQNNYEFNLALKGGDVDMDLTGDFEADEEAATVDIDFILNSLNLSMLEKLTDGEVRDGKGQLSGEFKVDGTTAAPQYQGAFNFKEAGFNIAMINMFYTLSDEGIRLNNEGIFLDKFTIRDEDDNIFAIDGKILTEDLANPVFDLQLTADDFKLLNSTRDDNDLFYGKANVDADIKIQGNLTLPELDVRLAINEGTELTLIIPESQLDVVEREGVVLFVNRENPEDILTQRAQEQALSGYTGYQVKSVLEVSPDAVFRVVVDERTGDNLEIAGQGNLSVDLNPNGNISMSGSYELTRGHYEMSFYNLVNRRFEIDPGSTIRWRGEPLDADLNIAAIYKVRTNAQSLMATQLTGADAAVSTQFRQELNFRVYLQVNGELMRPEISFRLDMEENDQGAFGGSVYDRLQQLNESESDLNKQVVSLLVLNQFMPDTGSDGSGGGSVSLARSSVSQVLSGQLNALSGRLLGGTGVELDFDLDSYTDYQSGAPADRTQLNVSARRRFMDDRLVVQVGSQMDLEGSSQVDQDAAGVFGNVSVEYLLNESGRTRLRIYRKNEFVSLVDGQLIVTGIGLIYQREFNHFRELWRKVEDETKRAAEQEDETEGDTEEKEEEDDD